MFAGLQLKLADAAAAEPGTDDLKLLAALEGLEPEREPEGPTMMGREARELMLSGRGEQGLQLFKARSAPVSRHQHGMFIQAWWLALLLNRMRSGWISTVATVHHVSRPMVCGFRMVRSSSHT